MTNAWLMALALTQAVGAPVGTCAPPDRGAGTAVTMKLHLTLEVTSLEGRPLPSVWIRFLDTAPPRDERGAGISLGLTDSTGNFDRQMEYTWPDYWSPTRRPDSGTFDILVGHDIVEVIHGTIECLPGIGSERRLVARVAVFDGIIIE